MDPLEYLSVAYESWPTYAAILVVSLLAYSLVVRRIAVGILDPLFLILLGDAFGWSLVVTMYLRGDVQERYFIGFVASQLFFLLGIATRVVSAPQRKVGLASDVNVHERLPLAIFSCAALLQFFATLTIWSVAGFPLFRASRIGAFVGSGGLGILERIGNSSGEIALFSAMYIYFSPFRRRMRLPLGLFFFWFLFPMILSGSKSALLGLAQITFIAYLIFRRPIHWRSLFWGGKTGGIVFVLAALFAVGVIFVQQSGNALAALVALGFRVLSYADIYVFAYPNQLMDHLQGGSAWLGVFGSLLSTFRIIPSDMLDVNIGLQLQRMVSPDLNYIAGPNPRLAVFGYHYFGPFAFAFSFAIGYLLIMLQNNLFFSQGRRSFLKAMVAFELYLALAGMSVDFAFAMSKLATAIIGVTVVLLFALPIYYATARHRPG